MDAEFTLSSEAFKARMIGAMAHFGATAAGALKTFGDLVLEDAKDNFVPIDSADLVNSGRAEDPAVDGATHSIRLAFGDEASAPYAIAVHEHLSQFSPRSWQESVFINWSRGGPKYLELPVMQHSANLPVHIATRLILWGMA